MNGDIVAQRYAKALFALGQQEGMAKLEPVSYTHLTLPTN